MLKNCRDVLRKHQTMSVFTCKYSSETTKNEVIQNESQEQKNSIKQPVPKYDPKLVSKDDLKWRTPWHQKEGKHFDILRSFYREEPNTTALKRLSSSLPPDLTYNGIKKWIAAKNEEANMIYYGYVPQRNKVLGDELAAAHFVVSKGGAIKFVGEDRWIKADDNRNYSLPRFYDGNKVLEAVDCSYMDIVYESLENFRNLQQLQWLSFRGCDYIDDWCLDMISNVLSETLLYLDIRDCPNISYRGLGAIAKMRNLKILYLDDFYRATTFEMTCLLLQENHADLEIKSDEVKFEVK